MRISARTMATTYVTAPCTYAIPVCQSRLGPCQSGRGPCAQAQAGLVVGDTRGRGSRVLLDSSSEIPLWRFSDSCNHGMSSNGEAPQSPTAPKCSTEHAPPSTGASSGRTIGHLGHLQSPEQAARRWLRTRSRPYRWWNNSEYVYSLWLECRGLDA